MPVRRHVAAAIYGVDLGKTRFDVIASDPAGKPVQRVQLGRDTLRSIARAGKCG